ncbi:hypothetical protein ALC53_06926 [Atta colombica]|uniref:Uncharacterized protein n=1 Tax=Atta colombica TaxID=520822 RepID=A0A195BE12_9HYME|nr:hypothetical protein ALC53_06926 [Atta colombica]
MDYVYSFGLCFEFGGRSRFRLFGVGDERTVGHARLRVATLRGEAIVSERVSRASRSPRFSSMRQVTDVPLSPLFLLFLHSLHRVKSRAPLQAYVSCMCCITRVSVPR